MSLIGVFKIQWLYLYAFCSWVSKQARRSWRSLWQRQHKRMETGWDLDRSLSATTGIAHPTILRARTGNFGDRFEQRVSQSLNKSRLILPKLCLGATPGSWKSSYKSSDIQKRETILNLWDLYGKVPCALLISSTSTGSCSASHWNNMRSTLINYEIRETNVSKTKSKTLHYFWPQKDIIHQISLSITCPEMGKQNIYMHHK